MSCARQRLRRIRTSPRPGSIRSRAWCSCRHRDALHRWRGRRRIPARRRLPFCADRSRAANAASCSAPNAIGLRYARRAAHRGYNISIGKPVTLAVFRSTARHDGGQRHRTQRRRGLTPLRRCAANVVACACDAAAAAARRRRQALAGRCRAARDRRRVTLACFLLVHDPHRRARSIRAVGTLAALAHRFVRRDHRFRQVGWFLWPLGLSVLALAALPPALPRISQRVLAAIMVRVGFLFVAIARARACSSPSSSA